jgi:hypothetical protein
MPPPVVADDAYKKKIILSTALEADGRGLRLYVPYVGGSMASPAGETPRPVGWTRSQKAALVREMVEAAGSEPVAAVRVLVPAARLKAEGGRALAAEMRGYLEPAFAARGQDLPPKIRARCARCFWRKRRLAAAPDAGTLSPSRACPRTMIRSFAGPSASFHLSATAGPPKRGRPKKGTGVASKRPRSGVDAEDASETKREFSRKFVEWFHSYRWRLKEKNIVKSFGFNLTEDIAEIFPDDSKYSHLSHVYDLKIITNIDLGGGEKRTFILIGDDHPMSEKSCYRGKLCGNSEECRITTGKKGEKCNEATIFQWVQEKIAQYHRKTSDGKFIDVFIETAENSAWRYKKKHPIPEQTTLHRVSSNQYTKVKNCIKESLIEQFATILHQHLLHDKISPKDYNLRAHYVDFRKDLKIPFEDRKAETRFLGSVNTIYHNLFFITKKKLLSEKERLFLAQNIYPAVKLRDKFKQFLTNDTNFQYGKGRPPKTLNSWKEQTNFNLHELINDIWKDVERDGDLHLSLRVTGRFLYKICAQIVHFEPRFRQEVISYYMSDSREEQSFKATEELKTAEYYQEKPNKISAGYISLDIMTRLMDIYAVCRMLRPDITKKNDLTILVAGADRCQAIFGFLLEEKYAQESEGATGPAASKGATDSTVPKVFMNTINEDGLCLKLRPSSDKSITLDNLCPYLAEQKIPVLDLSGCGKITGLGKELLVYLSLKQGIVDLRLERSKQVDDRLLQFFAEHGARFQKLDLSYCPNITDQGLRHLSHLKELKILGLAGCEKITDLGLAHLANLPNLTILFIKAYDEKITPAGVKKLEDKLPGITIYNSE